MQNQKGNIGVIISFIIVAGVIGLLIYALMNKPVKVDPLEGITKVDSIENTNKDSQAEGEKEGQLQEESLITNKNMETNKNASAKNGDTLVMNYTGRFTNGKTFDSNVDPKFGHVEPFKFKLGAHQVIAGWDEGLVGMKVGEKKTLTVSPEKGYGPNDYNGIPGGSTLIFEVELVGIE